MATKDPRKPLNLKRKEKAHKKTPCEPAAKKRNPENDRFSFNVTTDELEGFMEGSCPENTVKSTE